MNAARVCTVKIVCKRITKCKASSARYYTWETDCSTSQIDDGKVLELKCPNPTCAKILTEEQVGDIVRDTCCYSRLILASG